MDTKKDLKDVREKIDSIDEKITTLFMERMNLALDAAKYKKEHQLPTLDRNREKEILHKISNKMGEPLDRYGRILFHTLFDVSRSYQYSYTGEDSPLKQQVRKSISETPEFFPEKATVACQGIEGAYSEAAAEKLFSFPTVMFFNSFEGVFNAVEKGLCEYGLLPIENSSYGSVGRVYDLMKNHNFSIAKVIKLKVSHTLLVNQGTKISDIKEIISHDQAIGQCSQFIKELGDGEDIKVTICDNTAVAAETVANSGRSDIAAISSKECASIYGLEVLKDDIQISDHNYTRFICISKELQIYPGANKISLMISLPHRPMSLYNTISKFSSMGLNLTKLESRPIPGSDFEFMFYFDIEASVRKEEVLNLLCELNSDSEIFVFLGNYTELS